VRPGIGAGFERRRADPEAARRVIVTRVGRRPYRGELAATLASTGTPAYFVHAAEAAHGDLGMITAEDVVIALSNSGASEELLTIVPLVKRQGAKLITMTGKPDSPLAREADVHLDAAVDEEACPLNLAPTASTTAALALGDALAVALLDARGFGTEDFARSHPGGSLGRRLLTHVSDVMRAADHVPQVTENVSMTAALLQMTRGGMGMTAVVDANGTPIGIFTDGDLRRALERGCDARPCDAHRSHDPQSPSHRSGRPRGGGGGNHGATAHQPTPCRRCRRRACGRADDTRPECSRR